MTSRKRRLGIILLVVLLAGVLQPLTTAQAAVTLISFSASADPTNNKIVVAWQTGSELSSSGFYVLRSQSATGTYTRINATQIPSTGDVVGAEYSYDDLNVADCVVYFYRLEAIDNTGHSVIYERDPGSNQIVNEMMDKTGNCASAPTPTSTNTQPPNFTPSPTATSTRTPTPTVTQTPTNTPVGFTQQPSVTPTRTPTRTPFPTSPPTNPPTSTSPPQPSPTQTLLPGAVGQITATMVPTPTATLEPLPTMQLIFPVQPTAKDVTPGVTVIVLTPTPVAGSLAGSADISSRLMLLLGVVIVLWLGLMMFMVVFLRKTAQ